ncbi:hypothetical protein BG004_002489 [Podila humilis]|nr:hypothetical protein BG004_002489 [Podila humilis]
MKIFNTIILTLGVLASATFAVPVAQPDPSGFGLPTDILAQSLNNIQKRTDGTDTAVVNIDAIVDSIVKISTDVIVKAIVKLKLDICTDIHAKLRLVATGLIPLNTDLTIPKISARIDQETNAVVNTKVQINAQILVVDKIKANVVAAIHTYCPDDKSDCLSQNAKKIVRLIEQKTKDDVLHLFVAVRTDLRTHLRPKLELVLNRLTINLVLEKIQLAGFVDAVAQVDVTLHACAHAIVKGFHTVVARNAVKVLKALD